MYWSSQLNHSIHQHIFGLEVFSKNDSKNNKWDDVSKLFLQTKSLNDFITREIKQYELTKLMENK